MIKQIYSIISIISSYLSLSMPFFICSANISVISNWFRCHHKKSPEFKSKLIYNIISISVISNFLDVIIEKALNLNKTDL